MTMDQEIGVLSITLKDQGEDGEVDAKRKREYAGLTVTAGIPDQKSGGF